MGKTKTVQAGKWYKTSTLFCCVVLATLGLMGCEEDPIETAPLPPLNLNELAPSYFGRFTEPPDNPTTREGVSLGRMLFYEKRLSGNQGMSCGSCHQQAHGFAEPRQFSVGITGAMGTKNAMSLANLLWAGRFFWDGRSQSLEEQALIPIEDPLEMNHTLEGAVAALEALPMYQDQFKAAFGDPTITPERIGKALAQFQRTLISANSRYDQYLRGEYQPTDLELQGIQLFFTHPIPQIGLRGGNCGDCHLGPLTSGERNRFLGFHNNGLDDDENLQPGLQNVTGNPFDRGKFRAPGLRNIAKTAPYMHDGRFQTLEEVLDHYDLHIRRSETLDPLIIEASNEILLPGDPIRLHLLPQEKQAILAFLHMLTDEDFLQNPAFSDPFKK